MRGLLSSLSRLILAASSFFRSFSWYASSSESSPSLFFARFTSYLYISTALRPASGSLGTGIGDKVKVVEVAVGWGIVGLFGCYRFGAAAVDLRDFTDNPEIIDPLKA